MENLKRVLVLLSPYRTKIYILSFTAIFISGLSFTVPFVSQYMFDNGLVARDTHILIICICLLISINFINSIIELFQNRIQEKLRIDIGNNLRTKVFDYAFRLRIKYYNEYGFYKIVSDALYSVDNILEIFQESFLTIFVIAFKTIGACLALCFLSWKLTICVILVIPFKYLFNVFIGQYIKKYTKSIIKCNAEFNSWIDDVIEGIMDIKIWGLRKVKISELKNIYEKLSVIELKRGMISEINSQMLINIDTCIGYLIYFVGIFFLCDINLSVGGILAFVSYAGYLLNPLNVLLDVKNSFEKLKPAFEELTSFFEMEEEQNGKKNYIEVPKCIEEIKFQNVTCKLDGKQVIHSADFVIHRGEKIAIVGENGSGKTTIFNMLLRLIIPSEGMISMNGMDISNFEIDSYRKLFSVVPQSIHLFTGTVEDNIYINGKNNNAKELSGNEILFLGDRKNLKIGSSGMKLSGGERQKIAFMRALQRKTKILLLDEATANYDYGSEAEFNKYIANDCSFDFYIIISHRKDILQIVDKVINIEDGQVKIMRKGKK